jgi:hypothetical protein
MAFLETGLADHAGHVHDFAKKGRAALGNRSRMIMSFGADGTRR